MSVVVHGQAVLAGSSYRISSVPIRVGKKVTIVGPKFEVQTVIMDVEAAK